MRNYVSTHSETLTIQHDWYNTLKRPFTRATPEDVVISSFADALEYMHTIIWEEECVTTNMVIWLADICLYISDTYEITITPHSKDFSLVTSIADVQKCSNLLLDAAERSWGSIVSFDINDYTLVASESRYNFYEDTHKFIKGSLSDDVMHLQDLLNGARGEPAGKDFKRIAVVFMAIAYKTLHDEVVFL